jgi:hypothetical protein
VLLQCLWRQDNVQAHKWLDLAAASFGASNREDVDLATGSRDAIATKMTPEQIAEAKRLARDWTPKPRRLSPRRSPAPAS